MVSDKEPRRSDTSGDTTSNPANPTQKASLAEFLEDHAVIGAVYRVSDLRADVHLPNLPTQTSPQERALPAGKVTTVFEDEKKGERVRAIRYDVAAMVLVNAQRPDQPPIEAVLAVEKKTNKSLFRVNFNRLPNEEFEVNGAMLLENPRLYVTNNATRSFAEQWGLEAAWDSYRQNKSEGLLIPFRCELTSEIATRTLRSLTELTPQGF